MKLSILIPMYNASKYIGNCLDSLLNQDIPKEDYEIIIIDDGSTDNSSQIVENYQNINKNIFLFSQNNSGLYATRNKLLKLAKGDYIYNLDADDYIAYNSLGHLLARAEDVNVDILGFDSLKTRSLNLINSNTKGKNVNFDYCNGIDFISKREHFNTTVWWYFIKREFLNDEKISFNEGNPFEDGPFTLKLFLRAKIVLYLDSDIHRYVQVPTSIMNNNNYEHLSNVITDYVNVTYSFNELLTEISSKKEKKFMDSITKIRFYRDVNLYHMFFRIVKANISISKINVILSELKKINAYPISYFIERKFYKVIIFIFNHRYLFYMLVYPFRILYKLKLIK